MATGRLAEVEEDAMRIQARRFRDQEEERQYEVAKEAEAKAKAEQAEKKGK